MRLKLKERKIEVLGVETFIFEPLETIVILPGQFLHYVLHHRPTDERGSDRWFTNAAAPHEKFIQITTRFAEEKGSTFKNALKEMNVGEILEASEIEGDFVLSDTEKEYVFIAGGIGITPVRSILKDLEFKGENPDITLLYANRDESIVFKNELEAIAQTNSNLNIHYVISPDLIDEVKIRETVPNFIGKTFYISGPDPMVDAMVNILKSMGIKDSEIKQDGFPGYKEA